MNGILVVDKPAGFTSFDVVAKLRGMCGTKKIGHGGTLDPMATGVLPVFVGRAAKAADLAPNQDKAYEAGVLLGLRTDTGDVTGAVLERAENAAAGRGALAALLPRFLGEQTQTPPMYSAVKIDGKPLYKYAREGKQVERKARRVVIHSLALAGNGPAGERLTRFGLSVACGKGTYIRALVEDIGAALGLPATLESLRRTRAGAFGLAQAHTLEDLQRAKDAGRLEALLLPVGTLFTDLPEAPLGAEAAARLRNGAPVYGMALAPGRYRATCGGAFMGLARVDGDGLLKVEKLLEG